MLRKILKMFKDSHILKAHLLVIVVGIVLYATGKSEFWLSVFTPIFLLFLTVGGCLWINRQHEKRKMDWAEGSVNEHERYAMLEANALKMCPQYAYLHKMMKEKMTEMGVNPEEHLHPTWLMTFKIWLHALARQYETFEMTDIQVAAAILSSLVSPADSEEHIMIIIECIKDMIKAPKKYELRFEKENVVLNESTIIMPTSDPDEYIKNMGEEKFIKYMKNAISNREFAEEETTVCGLLYDMYYTTKSF